MKILNNIRCLFSCQQKIENDVIERFEKLTENILLGGKIGSRNNSAK